jgi:hypothetical protein
MRARFLAPIVAALALLAVPPAASAQGTSRGKGGGRAAHPKVGAVETCEACHAEATPAAFRDWSESAHGINLVKCFVCHGSVGADFTRRPVADRCIGCHADQVASMRAPAMKGKDCFSCHTAHALNPHATTRAASTAAALGADRLAPMVTVEGRIPPPAPAAAPPPAAAAPAPAAQQPGATSSPATAGPGAEKDVKEAQPHPPTDR